MTEKLSSSHRKARVLMIQGTNSDVGKSLIVAGLCRAFARQGWRVRPFKAQNMSNNAAVTIDSEASPHPDGTPRRGEIGRAQALQAKACGAPPSVHMNPILLKPQSDINCQLVLRGRALGTYSAAAYQAMKRELLPAVLESLQKLAGEADLVLIEGAGCGAEQYLRANDISNMGLSEAADLPAILLGEDSRGGMTAAALGAYQLFSDSERSRIKGFLVNRFRGDPAIFAPAAEQITRCTGWPNLGLIRWFNKACSLAPEDSLALDQGQGNASRKTDQLHIVVPRLPRVANFDDLEPLAAEPGVAISWIPPGTPLPRDADIVMLPGSKATRSDLEFLYQQGWHHDIHAHVRHGGYLVGLCGGFQMLGQTIRDPHGIEGSPGEIAGLGYIDMATEIGGDKKLIELDSTDLLSDCRISGYEMHMGRSFGPGLENPWLLLKDADGLAAEFTPEQGESPRPEGAQSPSGQVMGGYLHGIFNSDDFRSHWLTKVAGQPSSINYTARIESTLDALAAQLEEDLDLNALWQLAEEPALISR
ncbi:cobyric acid synthase [Halorhodospira halochloris]|uniref:cobyric acid synthase n=1 Tax=Halorhodospira halochloris TaxID=1052 RepID=UPI003083EF13